MFQRFSDRAMRVLKIAQYEAEQFGRPKIGTEHVLLAMAIEATGVAGELLRDLDVTEECVRRAIADLNETPDYDGHLMFTPNAKRALDLALRQAIGVKDQVGGIVDVRTEHVLLGVLLQDGSSATRVLQHLQTDMDVLMGLVLWSASGVDAEMAVLIQSGQTEEATKLIQRHIRVADAVATRARSLQDQAVSLAAGVVS